MPHHLAAEKKAIDGRGSRGNEPAHLGKKLGMSDQSEFLVILGNGISMQIKHEA